MKLCILCEDKNVEEARARSLDALPAHPREIQAKMIKMKTKPSLTNENFQHLRIPVSPNGSLPATHWFCFITVNEETHQKMLKSQKYTIIEEGVPSVFLAKHGLQRIKSTSTLF